MIYKTIFLLFLALGTAPNFILAGEDLLGENPLSVVSPAPLPQGAPQDAIVLLKGNDLSAFRGTQQWKKGDGFVTVSGKTNVAQTKQAFGDCQLHLEFAVPDSGGRQGQYRGNSGIYFMGLYELQILDSHQNDTYADGQCAALYRQRPPLVNASRPPGQWQSYDISFTAPRFDLQDGTLLSPAYVTVYHNGVLVQNHASFFGPTDLRKKTRYTQHPAKLPIKIQNHGSPVKFRNIWIRENVGIPSGVPGAITVSHRNDWTDLLDYHLKGWDRFLGVPHPSIKGLPPGTETSENFKEGTPIGPNNDFLKVFTVRDTGGEPVVRISGEVCGSLITKKTFSNYHLRMQFKWGKRRFAPFTNLRRNSGLLYHSVGEPGAYVSSWMTSLECQLKETEAGSLFSLHQTSANVSINQPPPKVWPNFLPNGKKSRQRIVQRSQDHGKPTGWNTIEVMTIDDRAIHLVNGHVVMVLTDARWGFDDDSPILNSGKIQLQSEGSELYVRRLQIKPLTRFPDNALDQLGLDQNLEFAKEKTAN